MVIAVGLGAVVGLGLWLVVVGLRPPRRSPAVVLAELHTTADPNSAGRGAGGWSTAWTRLALRLADAAGVDRAGLAQDLMLVGTSREGHARAKLTYATVCFASIIAGAALVEVGGVTVPPTVVAIAAVVAAVGGFMWADVEIRRQATRRRRMFRHALSGFVDLVVAAMAGGAHTNEALLSAAEIGDSDIFVQLRIPLERAQRANEPLWASLTRFAAERGLTDMYELTSALALVEDDGAKVRQSLAARAQAMRDRELADAQSEAEIRSETMGLPQVLMLVGFLVLVGYPAITKVLSL